MKNFVAQAIVFAVDRVRAQGFLALPTQCAIERMAGFRGNGNPFRTG